MSHKLKMGFLEMEKVTATCSMSSRFTFEEDGIILDKSAPLVPNFVFDQISVPDPCS
jgi:hypothetical protein